jgi:hypothetical protein
MGRTYGEIKLKGENNMNFNNLKRQKVRGSHKGEIERFVSEAVNEGIPMDDGGMAAFARAAAAGIGNPLLKEWRRMGCGQGNIKPMVSPKKGVRSETGRSIGGFLHGIYSTRNGGFIR